MLSCASSRDWFFSRCIRHSLNKPDEGFGGAATDLADPAMLAIIPGADGLPTEEEAEETEAPSGSEEMAEESAGEGDGGGDDDADGMDGADEGEGEDDSDGADDPAKQLETLSAENAELKKQVEELKATQPAPVLAPTRSNPLANVNSERGLEANAAFAKQLKAWARRASKDGGEMPKEIQSVLEGVKPEEITEARTLTAEEAIDLEEQADAMLTEHIPARRRYLQEEAQATAYLKEHYPQMLDSKTEHGKVFAAFQQQMPEIKLLSRWPTALAATVIGHLQMQREYEAKQKGGKGGLPKKEVKTVETKDGKKVPLAPGAANGGVRRPVTTGGTAKRAVEAGQKMLSGKASEADMLAVFSVAE